MKDRVPGSPGRVLITPENGGAAFHATLTRADNPSQEGTPLNKASLLTDATAGKFGLGAEATPNDTFNAIHDALEGVEQTITVSVPLSWTADSKNGGYYKTVTVSGILASDTPVADVVLTADVSANDAYLDAWADVTRIVTANGSVTLYANKKAPTSAFNMQLKVVR